MAQYISSSEFLASAYGADYAALDSIFTSSGMVDQYLQAISAIVDLYCNRSFEMQRYVEQRDNLCERSVYLAVMPVTGIVSVTYQSVMSEFGLYNVMAPYGSAVFGTSGVIDPNNYMLNPKTGRVRFGSNLNPEMVYTFTYDAGYAQAPDGIRQATMMLANAWATSIDNSAVAITDGGALSEFSFAKFTERYANSIHKNPDYEGGIPLTVMAILKRYRYLK